MVTFSIIYVYPSTALFLLQKKTSYCIIYWWSDKQASWIQKEFFYLNLRSRYPGTYRHLSIILKLES